MWSGVEELQRLNELRQSGKMHWSEHAHAWAAEPRDVVEALAHEGFAEYKLAVTRSRRDRPPTGGVWQGLNLQTGAVASAIWVQRASDAESIVFIDIDGELIDGGFPYCEVARNLGHDTHQEESVDNRNERPDPLERGRSTPNRSAFRSRSAARISADGRGRCC